MTGHKRVKKPLNPAFVETGARLYNLTATTLLSASGLVATNVTADSAIMAQALQTCHGLATYYYHRLAHTKA